MAHYAFIYPSGRVAEVIVGKDENEDGINWEQYYTKVKGLECKRTSYNTRNNTHLDGGVAFRGNFAGVGYLYDRDNDVFIPPQPYESWTLDKTTWNYVPPIDYPNDDNIYEWNENTQQWDIIDE